MTFRKRSQGLYMDFICFLFIDKKIAPAEFEDKSSGRSPKEETMMSIFDTRCHQRYFTAIRC